MKRFLLIAVCLTAIFFSLFVIAAHFGYTDPAYARQEIEALRRSPHGLLVAAAVIIGLLVADLLLPVPSSVLMTLAGVIYGAWLGGLIGFAGTMLAAALGFYACRWGGQKTFKRLMGDEDVDKIDAWFREYGVYAIILSRPVPMLTEILSCLAGLSGLRARTFFLASALGHLPICMVYSFAGSLGGVDDPWPAILAALLIPAAGWRAVRRLKRGKTSPGKTAAG